MLRFGSIGLAGAIAVWMTGFWWMMPLAAFLAGMVWPHRRAFWSGFGAVAVALILIGLYRDFANDHILSARMAALFHLPGFFLFLVVMVLPAALASGLACLSGASLRNALRAAAV